jgi:MFS family permease
MMGIYYAAPLLGPSLGPLFGGVLTQIWNWRATFYFLTIIGGVVLISLFMFRDTFRRERSLTYQSAKRHAIRRAEEKRAKRERNSDDAVEKGGQPTSVDPETVKVTLIDLNPFKPIWSVLTRKNNLSILFPSGKSVLANNLFFFDFTYSRLALCSPIQRMFYYGKDLCCSPLQL